ncbi:Imm32 family immunity protein [Kribbella sp. NBC_01245]|uniref:Imm32 family immunity protein n=1 Tax=Kribbella sp. NBC_01245 TaxID=2903578 RepID=UPI003FA55CFB
MEIEANLASPRDLARWCLALADPDAPSGSHIHFDPGVYLLTPDSESLILGRSDGLVAVDRGTSHARSSADPELLWWG